MHWSACAICCAARSAQERTSIIRVIEQLGGECVGSNSWDTESTFSHACTHVVVLTQEHASFALGQDANKALVTPVWVEDCSLAKKLLPAWPQPVEKPWHRPLISREPPAAMRRLVIAQTNYRGAAKNDVEDMVRILGATFTTTLSMSNTHLVCREYHGAKYEKAIQWKLKMVNHRWLRGCLRSPTRACAAHRWKRLRGLGCSARLRRRSRSSCKKICASCGRICVMSSSTAGCSTHHGRWRAESRRCAFAGAPDECDTYCTSPSLRARAPLDALQRAFPELHPCRGRERDVAMRRQAVSIHPSARVMNACIADVPNSKPKSR